MSTPDPHFYCTKFCGWQGTAPLEGFDKWGGHAVGPECRMCGAPAREGVPCATCGQAVSAPGLDDCAACFVAYCIAEDRDALDLELKRLAGTRDGEQLAREAERQLGALVACGRAA